MNLYLLSPYSDCQKLTVIKICKKKWMSRWQCTARGKAERIHYNNTVTHMYRTFRIVKCLKFELWVVHYGLVSPHCSKSAKGCFKLLELHTKFNSSWFLCTDQQKQVTKDDQEIMLTSDFETFAGRNSENIIL